MHPYAILVFRVILLAVCALLSRRLGGVTDPLANVVSSLALWCVVRTEFRPRSARRRSAIGSRQEQSFSQSRTDAQLR